MAEHQKPHSPSRDFADHIFGIFTVHGHPLAAYVRHSENHGGFVVYNAQSGRALSGAYPSVEEVERCENFKRNAELKATASYVGLKSNEDDPVRHER